MNTTIKLATLVLVIIGLSACGRMGELEPVKAEKVAVAPAPEQVIVEVQVALVEQEIDIMPHNSK
jgi:predicted small lipoprotein YifL